MSDETTRDSLIERLREVKICADPGEDAKCGLDSGPFCRAHGLDTDWLVPMMREAADALERIRAEGYAAGRAEVLAKIRHALVETCPDRYDDTTVQAEQERFGRALLAAEHDLFCEKCGAPAHRGPKADELYRLWLAAQPVEKTT